jgi:hypothetical protein
MAAKLGPRLVVWLGYTNDLEGEMAQSADSADPNVQAGNAAKKKLLEKLAAPDRVFGEGQRNKQSGAWETKPEEGAVAVMQLIERGFISNDSMEPTEQGTEKHPKGVMNAEMAGELARHGFAPLSSWGDTMHFDYIQGYNESLVGGRNTDLTFGPLGAQLSEKGKQKAAAKEKRDAAKRKKEEAKRPRDGATQRDEGDRP